MAILFRRLWKRAKTNKTPVDLKYLIVGLGNIGPEYTHTRHNIGFDVLDAMAEASGIIFEQKRYAFVCNCRFKGRTLILIKPSTYVNLSGRAVNYWLQKEKIPFQNLLVVVDDLALPFGTIRLKAKGGAAGHNGLTNIIETFGRQDFARLRFGIGDNFSRGRQVDHVLGHWTTDEQAELPKHIESMIQAIKSFASIGIAKTMNHFNKK